MDFVVAFAPGAITGLLGFGTLVILAGRFWSRRFRRGRVSVASYALVVAFLWIICLMGGGAMFWPLLMKSYDVHHAVVVFLIPYVVITPTVAGIALMKYGNDLLSNSSFERTK